VGGCGCTGYVQIRVFSLMGSGRFVFGLLGVESPGWFESVMNNNKVAT